MFRRFSPRNSFRARDPPAGANHSATGKGGSFSTTSGSSFTQHDESEGTPPVPATTHSFGTSSRSTMRSTSARSKAHTRSFDHRSTSSSGHTATSSEDRMRLRSILRGAMTTPAAAPDESDKKAIMKRVLARSQHMDRTGSQTAATTPPAAASHVPSPPPPAPLAATSKVPPTLTPPQYNRPQASRQATQSSLLEKPISQQVNRIESNPTALDFRNRLRKLTAQHSGEEGPHPGSSHATTFLDEKTREMIQQRFRKRQTTTAKAPPPLQQSVPPPFPPPPPPPLVTRREEKVAEEDDDSADLEGYAAFFETLKNEVHGQHSLLWVSFAAVMKNETTPELEPVPATKSYRFDKRTKEMLTIMNAYMQEKSNVAHVSATQLVNDKKFSKEWKRQQQTKGDSRTVGPPSDRPIVASPQKPPQRMPEKIIANRPKEAALPTISIQQSSPFQAGREGTSLPSTTAADVAPSMDFESQSNPGVEITLDLFELKSTSSKQPKTPSEVSGAPSWSSVQLRSVRQEGSEAAQKSKTPNFAKVQLRKIARPQEMPKAVLTVETEEETSVIASSPKEAEITRVDNVKTEAPPAAPPKAPVVKAPLVPPQVERQTEFTKSVKTEESDKADKKKIDEAYFFNLQPEPNDSEGVQNKIIFGRKHIMMVKAENNNKQALVVWKLLRTDATSLTIDMTQMMVKLISREKSVLRELYFETSEDCLKFANTFYEKLQNKISDDNGGAEEPRTKVPQAVIDAAEDDGDTEFAAVRLERLNDEEQAVLDTYRRLRRSKPPKDALAESVSKDSGKESPESLTEEDEKIASKYRKMLKLRIPVDAVEHSMKKDGVAQHIIDAVVVKPSGVPDNVDAADLPTTPVSTFSNTSGLSESDAATVEKYRKMLKMGIPEDGVRHRLLKDGIDAKFHEFIFESSAAKGAATLKPSSLSPADEVVAAHYRKLISRGVPKDSVRWGMTKDNVKPHIIAAVVGESQDPGHVGANTAPAKGAKDALTVEEERIATEFKKLLKRQIPRQRILERMKREGVSEKVIVAVLGKSSLSVSTKENEPKGKSSQFVQIHWTPLSGSQLDNSVWNATKNRSFEVAAREGFDFPKLKELFEKKKNNHAPKSKTVSQSSSASNKAKLLDINRSNNIAISLKAFKEYTFTELSEIVRFLDPLRKLQGERVHFLRDLLPTVSETKLMQGFDGPESMLDPAERWFKSIVNIKRIDSKVSVLRTMEMLEVEARSIGENLRLLAKVCNQVINSDKLQDLLVVVLQIGNIMNEGTRTGGAAGFKMDSLLKLTQTKSADGKTTVLDYLVEDLFIAKGERHKLDLLSDFPECSMASRMLIGDLVAEVKAIQDSVAQCKDELEALRRESLGKNTGVSTAIAKIESHEKNSIHGAIGRLEDFLAVAENIVASLLKEKDEALQASQDLCLYCGEGSGTAAATTLLGILSEFATSIESAVRKSEEKKRRSERRQKRQGDDSESSKASETDHTVETNGESLVSLVNQMLKVANPRTIEDFRKGRVLDNPSKLMKTIYQKEQVVDVDAIETPRSSLANAIQEKTENLNDGDFDKARTKFGSPRVKQVRSPPVPWAPPLRERSSSGRQISSNSSEEQSEVASSFITDTSTSVDSGVSGNVESGLKSRSDRPTPEGAPLRARSNSANVASMHRLVPPSPEKATRDKTASDKTLPMNSVSEVGRISDLSNNAGMPDRGMQVGCSPNSNPSERNTSQERASIMPVQNFSQQESTTFHTELANQSSEDSQESPVISSGRVSAMAAAFSKMQSEPLVPSQPGLYAKSGQRASQVDGTSSTTETRHMINQAANDGSTGKEAPAPSPVDSDAENRPDPPSINPDSSKPDPPNPPSMKALNSTDAENSKESSILVSPPQQDALSVKSVGNDQNKPGFFKGFFDITAARQRIAARKSIESTNAGHANQPKKSLQEMAALKRERRSIERSPVKPQELQKSRSSSEQIPSVSGYLELARQKRNNNHRKSLGSKLVVMQGEGGQPFNVERESSFARMARQKRASRKNEM